MVCLLLVHVKFLSVTTHVFSITAQDTHSNWYFSFKNSCVSALKTYSQLDPQFETRNTLPLRRPGDPSLIYSQLDKLRSKLFILCNYFQVAINKWTRKNLFFLSTDTRKNFFF